MGRSWLCVVAMALSVGALSCTLIESYPAEPVEESEADCHDGRDNDYDGRTDCLDDSCARCVTRTSISCPMGWTSRSVVDAAVPTDTCAPPNGSFLSGCASAPDPGGVVIEASDDAVGSYLDAHTPATPMANGPPLVVWLAPGVHVERTLVVRQHVVIHGLCDGSTPATLRAAAGSASPIAVDSGHVEIDHVAIEVRPGASSSMGRGGALDVTSSTFTSIAGAGVLALDPSMTARFDRVSAQLDVYATGARLVVQRSLLRSVTGVSSRIDLSTTRVEGTVTVDGGVGTLALSNVFVQCGTIHGREGASVDVQDSLVVTAPSSAALIFSGTDGGDPATATLDDVVAVTSSACLEDPRPAAAAVEVDATEFHASRLAVHTTQQLALRLAQASVATLADAELGGGLSIEDASLEADRVHVPFARAAGVHVLGTSEVTLRGVFVESVPATPRAMTECTPYAAGLRLDSGRVQITDGSISLVSGCGIALAPGVSVTSLEASVDGAWAGLCTAGRPDAASLASGVTIAHASLATSDATGLCFAADCLGHGCPVGSESGLCTNGLDDDVDGFADCLDAPDCARDPACEPMTETDCTDGRDNDRDGRMDCDDTDCAADAACAMASTPEGSHCADGIDNDMDGLLDCADSDCGCDPVCTPSVEACPGMDLGSATGDVVVSASLPVAPAAWCARARPTCAEPRGTSLTYVWTAPAAGTYTFATGPGDVVGSSPDTVLEVLDDCVGPELACNDDSAGGLFSSVTIPLVTGQRVIVRVFGLSPSTPAETYRLSIKNT